jgi:hypothetical protein
MAPRGRGINITITGDGASAQAALQLVRDQLKQTSEEGKASAASLAAGMESIKTALTGLAIGTAFVGLREGIESIKEMVTRSASLALELSNVSKETGISAQTLSVMKYASDVTGVSFEALTKGMGRLSKTMLDAEEGKKQAIDSFGRLGISQQQVKDHGNDMLGMLGLVADKFQQLPDGPQKAAVAIGLFSRAGMGLVPFLDQGSAGITRLAAEAKALGVVLDQDGIDKLEQTHEALVKLQAGMQGAGLGITGGMTPALLGLASALQAAMTSGDGWQAVGQKLGNMTLELAASTAYLVKFVSQAVAEYMSLEGHLDGVVNKIDSKISPTQSARSAAAAELQKDIDETKAAAKLYNDAQTDYETFANQLATGLDGGTAPTRMVNPRAHRGMGTGITLADQSHPKSDDGVAKAAVALAEAQAEAVANATKAADEALLAQQEIYHKLGLTSDSNYYSEKLLLQNDMLDAQADALKTRIAEMQALEQKQQGDKLLKRNKSGQSAEELATQRQIITLNQQLNDIVQKRAELNSVAPAEEQDRADKVRLQTLQSAAKIEEQTNGSIEARLALLREESSLELEKIANTAGKDSPLYAQQQQLEAIEEAKLRIASVDRQIRAAEQQGQLAAAAVKDQLDKSSSQSTTAKKAAEQEINQINADTAKQLQVLVAQYDELAQTLGGEFIEKAAALHAELDKLNRPDNKQDSQFAKTLGDGMQSMAERMASAAADGSKSFHNMTKEIEKDAIDLAVKLTMQKWITPAIEGHVGGAGQHAAAAGAGGIGSALGGILAKMFGGGAGAGAGAGTGAPSDTSDQVGDGMGGYDVPFFADGGDYSGNGPIITSEKGPELMFPKGPGTVLPSTVLQKISETSSGASAPSVAVNVVNNSSQPVTAQTGGVSYNADMKAFIIHTILEDQAQGGPTAQAMQQNTG